MGVKSFLFSDPIRYLKLAMESAQLITIGHISYGIIFYLYENIMFFSLNTEVCTLLATRYDQGQKN